MNANLIKVLISVSLLLNSCRQHTDYTSFEGKVGFVYYSYPDTGPIISFVFCPYLKSTKLNGDMDDVYQYQFSKGIKLNTSKASIFNLLLHDTSNVGYLKNGLKKRVYIMPNVVLRCHIDEELYNKENVSSHDISIDTLEVKGHKLPIFYNISSETVDSISLNHINDH